MKRHLFLVDCQVDFCDPTGALYVKGADQDMQRLARLIDRAGDAIDDISATLDSHRRIQIFDPIYWLDNKNQHPSPFTIITEGDVTGQNPRFKATNPSWQARSVKYVQELAKLGRSPLILWPTHCQIGHKGHNVQPVLFDALQNWETKFFGTVDYVTKGSNIFTEMYSIFKADVVDSDDPTTDLNTGLIDKLREADEIWVAGEALSHCVNWSIRDCGEEFGDEHVRKFVLLEDASSPVWSPDPAATDMFKNMADQFIKDMVAKGMRIAKTTDL